MPSLPADPRPRVLRPPRRGPQVQPKKRAARALIVALRKQTASVYEISATRKERHCPLRPTAVREVLKAEGFTPLPRRRDAERPDAPRPPAEPIADVRAFSLASRAFPTRVGGLFLFLPDLVRLDAARLAPAARLPGSRMLPAAHALRACLALKLWSVERKSDVMALVADEGVGLFAGRNVSPKRSFLAEYAHRLAHGHTLQLLAAWHAQLAGTDLFAGDSFHLDFHSVPYSGEHPVVERHYVSARSRRQPSRLVCLTQDADSRAVGSANADLRKGEEAEEVFRFIVFWQRTHQGQLPRHLVFDAKVTTYAGLARLDQRAIPFSTRRRRSPRLLKEIVLLSRSAWRGVELEVPTRKSQPPRVYEQSVRLAGRTFRQLFIQDLGHDTPTILLTNQRQGPAKALSTRSAQRMLIENALADAVRFFHMDALSSAVGRKVDCDMALLVLASRAVPVAGPVDAGLPRRPSPADLPRSRRYAGRCHARRAADGSALSPSVPSPHRPGVGSPGPARPYPVVEWPPLAPDHLSGTRGTAEILGEFFSVEIQASVLS